VKKFFHFKLEFCFSKV